MNIENTPHGWPYAMSKKKWTPLKIATLYLVSRYLITLVNLQRSKYYGGVLGTAGDSYLRG